MGEDKNIPMKEQIEAEFYCMLTTGKIPNFTEYLRLWIADSKKFNLIVKAKLHL